MFPSSLKRFSVNDRRRLVKYFLFFPARSGDLLFVPAGCPHRVENMTDTLALSCNYVDATNMDASLKALRDQARGREMRDRA